MENNIKTKEEIWTEIFSEWETSGLSQKAYCKEKALVENTFYYWRKRLKAKNYETSFIKVQPRTEVIKSEIQIILRKGVRIEFEKATELKLITRVLEALSKIP